MSKSTTPTSTGTALAVVTAIIGALLAVGVLTIANGSWFGLIAIVGAVLLVPALLRVRRQSSG